MSTRHRLMSRDQNLLERVYLQVGSSRRLIFRNLLWAQELTNLNALVTFQSIVDFVFCSPTLNSSHPGPYPQILSYPSHSFKSPQTLRNLTFRCISYSCHKTLPYPQLTQYNLT